MIATIITATDTPVTTPGYGIALVFPGASPSLPLDVSVPYSRYNKGFKIIFFNRPTGQECYAMFCFQKKANFKYRTHQGDDTNSDRTSMCNTGEDRDAL